jgi:hypothetical protein
MSILMYLDINKQKTWVCLILFFISVFIIRQYLLGVLVNYMLFVFNNLEVLWFVL